MWFTLKFASRNDKYANSNEKIFGECAQYGEKTLARNAKLLVKHLTSESERDDQTRETEINKEDETAKHKVKLKQS